ncbi:MAG TPA: anti-sigma factor [Stellaceae bacterium]|nr:anti-sigma factor [Stellaceae bacterium]
MIPANHEELDILAGEYVLGVLDAAQANEIKAALPSHQELQRAVWAWERRLHGLSGIAPPAEPPPGTWEKIAARIAAPTTPARARLWNSVALWRWSTAAAAAVAAGLALYIAAAPPPPGPNFVAVLRAPQQDQPAWVATAGRNGLLVRAVAGDPVPSDRSFELWAIAPGAKRPESLGVIPPDGRLELGALPAAIRDGGALAISIEPKGGSPTGQATGPIVFLGNLVAAR